MYYVYIIKCEDGSLYTGITTDLQRRFSEHKKKIGSRYTASHKVEKIVHTEQCKTRSDALKRETQIKRLPRRDKLQLTARVK